MSIIISVVLCIIVLLAVVAYFVYENFISDSVKTVEEVIYRYQTGLRVIYRYQTGLRNCYNIKDMLSMRNGFRKEIEPLLGNKFVRMFLSNKHKIEVHALTAIMDERIRLLELSSFPTIKRIQNEI